MHSHVSKTPGIFLRQGRSQRVGWWGERTREMERERNA